MKIIDVAVGQAIDRLSYRAPEACMPGALVQVPLGKKTVDGIVLGPASHTLAEERLKDIVATYPHPLLPYEEILLLDWLSYYYLSDIGLFVRIMLRGHRDFLKAKPPRQIVHGSAACQRHSSQRDRVWSLLSEPFGSVRALAKRADVSEGLIRQMLQDSELVWEEKNPFVSDHKDDALYHLSAPALNFGQKKVLDAILCNPSWGGQFQQELLHGVTGSGKTLIYAHLTLRMLQRGRQILVMAPEIALAQALVDRFAAMIKSDQQPVAIHLWHGGMSPANRAEVWAAVQSRKPLVLIGVRSACLVPMPNLGLIIVDEEHDQGYKQDDPPRYHARDVSIKKAQLYKIPILIGSATPTIESLYSMSVRGGVYQLNNRVDGLQPIRPELIDMRIAKPLSGGVLSEPLCNAIGVHLERREQVLLFINRRGYAPVMTCGSCGQKPICTACNMRMIPHRQTGRLLCHWCGHHVAIPKFCTGCGQDKWLFFGVGIERLEEEVRSRFPDANIAMASSDILDTAKKSQRLWQDMQNGDIDILLGTQMATKGHDIPNLTLVGVVDGDPDHEATDPRARERLYQVLEQVAGRAGRHKKGGRVLVQTTRPDDSLFTYFEKGNFTGFTQVEEDTRSRLHFPPFSKMAAVIVSSPVETTAKSFAWRVFYQARMHNIEGAEFLGPVMAPIYKIRGAYRWRVLVRAPHRSLLEKALAAWVLPIQKATKKGCRIDIDIDPLTFH